MTCHNVQLINAIFADDSFKIKFLLEQGVDVNESDFFNIPPLLRAALYGKSEAFKTLIEYGADRNAKDKQGRTALQLAKKYNHQKIVEFLLQN
jgi:ankyrin repeat protein